MTHSEKVKALEQLQSNSVISVGWVVRGEEIELAHGEVVYEQQLLDALAIATTAQEKADVREATRTALREQWDALPAWINGPYRPLFDAANRLLDEGLDEAAFEMIDEVEPTVKITNDPEKSAIFASVKAQFLSVIESL